MEETDHALFILDSHASGSSLPAAPVLLRGRATAQPGFFITDLRVRLGSRIYPVFFGEPCANFSRDSKSGEPTVLGGFEVTLALVNGENRLEFEACEITGRWEPLATVIFTGTPCHLVPTAPSGTVGAHIFTRALRLVLQDAATSGIAPAADAVAALLPLPHVTRWPAVPFHGHLHHPPMLQRTEFGRVMVEGWLFHETERIRRVAATVDLQAWQILDHEGPQPDIAARYPQFPPASACRIHGAMDVPAQLPRPLSVRIYAELADGSWHLCHVERSHLYGDEQAKAPYARFSLLTFARCVHALRRSCQERNLAVPLDAWFYRGLREVWREYRAQAPRRSLRAPGPNLPLPSTGRAPGRVVLITHNLNFEGAPLYLLEFAAFLSRQGTKLSVIAAREGPLRQKFEAIGARVEVVDTTPLLQSTDARSLRAGLSTLASQVDLAGADLVIANTLSAYWGVHLAHRADKPSLFLIHESTTPDGFFARSMAPATLPVVKEAFSQATQVSFMTESTRRYFLPVLGPANHRIHPGWIDLARLNRFRSENPRAPLRVRLGLPSDRLLVVNVGTVCDRKGQHIFARAVDLLWRRSPALAARGEFLMVGGRSSAYDADIAGLLDYLRRPNLRVVPETPEPYVYFGAADLFVCSSYEESFPRVVLEAMAFSLPIVSTGVHGIPEMARAGQEALLVPPGDSSALADAMARVLADPVLAQTLGNSGRARVTTDYDAAVVLPRYAALASAVAGGQI